MAAAAPQNDEVCVEVDLLTREDTVVVTEAGAFVEKGLVLHGCKPPIKVGDLIVEVNDQKFSSCEDLTQLLTAAAHAGKKFSLKVSRVKGDACAISKIDRFVIELKRDNVETSFGISVAAEDGQVFVQTVNGLALEAGVKPKDLIKRLNGEVVHSEEDITRLMKDNLRIVFHIVRGTKITKNKVEFENKLISIRLQFESGDILGANIDKMVITSIQAGSMSENKLEVGDRIVEINGQKIDEDKYFYKLLQRISDGELYISVIRSVAKKDTDSSREESLKVIQVLISLAMAPYEAIGVRPDENLLISTIMDKSHAQGKFELGDVIKSLNGIPITNRNQFFKLFEDATSAGRIEIIVERSATRELELEKRQLPPHIEKIVKRHAGFDYLVTNVRFDSSSERVFGLNIANVTSHKIIVPDLAENCVAAEYLLAYDHIIAINGTPVSDASVAKKMIRECKANFQAVIERPITLETQAQIKSEVDEWRNKMSRPPPQRNLEAMPMDVQEIVLSHMKTRKERAAQPQLASVLRRGDNPQRRITFNDQHCETQIQSDVPITKRLRSCK